MASEIGEGLEFAGGFAPCEHEESDVRRRAEALLANFHPSHAFSSQGRLKKITGRLWEKIERDVSRSTLFRQGLPFPVIKTSSSFAIPGEGLPHVRIGGINGMNTNLEEAGGHAAYVASFVPDKQIEWVHNQTHGPILDVGEILTLNCWGYSPNTAKRLRENWTLFHEENQARPDAKYLQFCHSQGAIHVRNALETVSNAIRKRVIVVALAPGAIVPESLCYQAFNYASKKDWIAKGEAASVSMKELIWLDPHPDADRFLDHYFQSPTFKEVIARHIDDYLNGQETLYATQSKEALEKLGESGV